jgi:hypothetical protein
VRIAAVTGRRFEIDLLTELTGADDIQVLLWLKEAMSCGLVVEESADTFTFRHPLTRERSTRCCLLVNVAGCMRRLPAYWRVSTELQLPPRRPADLAYHYAQSGDWQRALPWAIQAGNQAVRLHTLRPAIQQFTLAIDCAERSGLPPSLDALIGRARAHDANGDFERAQRDYLAASQAALGLEDHRTRGEALLELGLLWSGRDEQRSRAYYEIALELGRACGLRDLADLPDLIQYGT